MKKYEAVFILDIRKADDEGNAFTKEFGELIESLGGKLESVTPMGRRQFTYEIKSAAPVSTSISSSNWPPPRSGTSRRSTSWTSASSAT